MSERRTLEKRMLNKIEAMRREAETIHARAVAEAASLHRPLQNEILLHYRQARYMLQRAQDLELIPGPVWPLGRVLELRCQALKSAYQFNRFPRMVEAETILWPSILADEDDFAIDPELSEADIEATLVGYLSPYVRAIGIRGLQVRTMYSFFNTEMYLTLKAPVFP